VSESNVPIILAQIREWWDADEIDAETFVTHGVEALMTHGWSYADAMDVMVAEVGG